jgi:hypothetical protein
VTVAIPDPSPEDTRVSQTAGQFAAHVLWLEPLLLNVGFVPDPCQSTRRVTVAGVENPTSVVQTPIGKLSTDGVGSTMRLTLQPAARMHATERSDPEPKHNASELGLYPVVFTGGVTGRSRGSLRL